MQLVECVPNFSEGRDELVIDEIVRAISRIPEIKMLDVDPGQAANRTVVTFIGPPDAVEQAAFSGIRKAAELIDMRHHTGNHPRMGATDVCPFIPVQNFSMEECVQLSKRAARRVGEELHIPVFLYEYSASAPHRKNLAQIRAGEYEGMQEKLADSVWKPDYGPNSLNEKAGVTAIGARKFLIAFNVNLNTSNEIIAKDIARTIRSSGRPVKASGRLQHVKAIGWYVPEYGCAQVSMNLTDYTITPMHEAYEVVAAEAKRRGAKVTGSEIVGMIPLQAIRESGVYFLKKLGYSEPFETERVLAAAIESLGLQDKTDFDQEKKVLEFQQADEVRRPSGSVK